jgi:hypothetical protein
MIDKTYLPFTADELKPHFIADSDRQINYYQKSACHYHEFMSEHPDMVGLPITKAKTPRQIEKDERFWTITATKNVFDHHSRTNMLKQLLVKTFGFNPPIPSLRSWEECLDGELRLYFEACLPSTRSYVKWLRENLPQRQMIPYVRDAATRKSMRPIEGATHVDAMFLNINNGFAWLIEAKVLSDVSYLIAFDNFRNQIARNIDVMLDNTSRPGSRLEKRDPNKSLFSLLTPMSFKQYPSSRLYGWLMQEYKNNPAALERDLPHREKTNWADLQQRIGWITFEDFQEVRPGACPMVIKETD